MFNNTNKFIYYDALFASSDTKNGKKATKSKHNNNGRKSTQKK